MTCFVDVTSSFFLQLPLALAQWPHELWWQGQRLCMGSTIQATVIWVVLVVQSLSCVQLFATPWTAARQASLSFTISWSLLKTTSIESMMPSNHLILCHPLLFLPSIFLSQHQGLFQWVNSSHQVAKLLELQLQQQPFQWIFRVYFL